MGKRCTKCGQVKPAEEFGKDRRTRDGFHQHCLECKRETRRRWRATHPEERREQDRAWSAANYDRHLARNRRWQAANRDKMRGSMLMSRYSLTPAAYQRLYEAQDGRYKICGEAGNLVVDHKHDETRQVRALLCLRCNSGIGFFRENVDTLLAAVGYLTLGDAYDRARYAVTAQITSTGAACAVCQS